VEDKYLGVYHTAELEFVFDNAWPPLVHHFSARDQAMADTFGFYWGNLVTYLDPNGEQSDSDQLTWPAYDSNLQSISLDVPASIMTALLQDKCSMWDSIAAYAPSPSTWTSVATE
jgi:carboxylesterase type B